jgi:hypothetical protein
MAALAGPGSAQTLSRRASLTQGGNSGRGKCTIEVVVDGTVEVEIRGDSGVLRNLGGQPPQWRRFECNSIMPANPAGFRFAGVDGRGKQELMRAPQNGAPAMIRITDPPGGSEGYTFDMFWDGGAGPVTQDRPRMDDRENRPPDRGRDQPDPDAYRRDRDTWFRGDQWRRQLFQRVRQDVDYVASVTFPSGGDRYRLADTRRQLDELQQKLAAGRYDQRELDDVIGALQRVVQDNAMRPRDRELLNDDLRRMAEFRTRHDDYGARDMDRGPGRDQNEFYAGRDQWLRDDNWRRRLFERVRVDLDHVASATFPISADEFRIVRTKQQLDELQQKLAAGRYDERELDDVIASMQRVTTSNRLAPRDRDVLADDLNRMREFRARHAEFGAR